MSQEVSVNQAVIGLSMLLIDVLMQNLDESLQVINVLKLISNDPNFKRQECDLSSIMRFSEIFFKDTYLCQPINGFALLFNAYEKYDICVICVMKIVERKLIKQLLDAVRQHCLKCYQNQKFLALEDDNFEQQLLKLGSELLAEPYVENRFYAFFKIQCREQQGLDRLSRFVDYCQDPSRRNMINEEVLQFVEFVHVDLLGQPTLEAQMVLLLQYGQWLDSIPRSSVSSADVKLQQRQIESQKRLIKEIQELFQQIYRNKSLNAAPFGFIFGKSVTESFLSFLLVQDLNFLRLFLCAASGMFQLQEGLLHEAAAKLRLERLLNPHFAKEAAALLERAELKISFVQLYSNIALDNLRNQWSFLLRNQNVFLILVRTAYSIQQQDYRFLLLVLIIQIAFGQPGTLKILKSSKILQDQMQNLNQNFGNEEVDVYLLAFAQSFLADQDFRMILLNTMKKNQSLFADNPILSNPHVLMVLMQEIQNIKSFTLQMFEIQEFILRRSQIAIKLYAAIRKAFKLVEADQLIIQYFTKYETQQLGISDETFLYLEQQQLQLKIVIPDIVHQDFPCEGEPFELVYQFLCSNFSHKAVVYQLFLKVMQVDVLSLFFSKQLDIESQLKILQDNEMLIEFISQLKLQLQDPVFLFENANVFCNSIQDTTFELLTNYTKFKTQKQVQVVQGQIESNSSNNELVPASDSILAHVPDSSEMVLGQFQEVSVLQIEEDKIKVIKYEQELREQLERKNTMEELNYIVAIGDTSMRMNQFKINSIRDDITQDAFSDTSETSFTNMEHDLHVESLNSDQQPEQQTTMKQSVQFLFNNKQFANSYKQNVDVQGTLPQEFDFIQNIVCNHMVCHEFAQIQLRSPGQPNPQNSRSVQLDATKIINTIKFIVSQPCSAKQVAVGPFQCNYCGIEIPQLTPIQFMKGGTLIEKQILDVMDLNNDETDDEMECQVLQKTMYCPDSKLFYCVGCASGRQLVSFYQDFQQTSNCRLKFMVAERFTLQLQTLRQPLFRLDLLEPELQAKLRNISATRLALRANYSIVTSCKTLHYLLFKSNQGVQLYEHMLIGSQFSMQDILNFTHGDASKVPRLNQHLHSLKHFPLSQRLLSGFNPHLVFLFSEKEASSRLEGFVTTRTRLVFSHVFQCSGCQEMKGQCAVCEQPLGVPYTFDNLVKALKQQLKHVRLCRNCLGFLHPKCAGKAQLCVICAKGGSE